MLRIRRRDSQPKPAPLGTKPEIPTASAEIQSRARIQPGRVRTSAADRGHHPHLGPITERVVHGCQSRARRRMLATARCPAVRRKVFLVISRRETWCCRVLINVAACGGAPHHQHRSCLDLDRQLCQNDSYPGSIAAVLHVVAAPNETASAYLAVGSALRAAPRQIWRRTIRVIAELAFRVSCDPDASAELICAVPGCRMRV